MKFKAFYDKYKYTFGTIILIAISIVFAIFVFSEAYKDLIESIDFAIKYTFGIFQETTENTQPPSIPAPSTPDSGVIILPDNPAIILARLRMLGQMFITGDTYSIFFSNLFYYVMLFVMWSPAILISIMLLKKLIVAIYLRENTKHGQVTLPLKLYLMVSKVSITPVSKYSKSLWQYLKTSKLRIVLIIIWLLNFNVISFIIPILPYYLYCAFNMSFSNLYEFIKFEIMKTKFIFALGLIVAIPIFIILFDKWRVATAKERLRQFEEYNRKMLQNREIVTYKDGVMGSGKTRTMTQEAIEVSINFTNKAFELKNVCKKMFPFFNWLLFELDIEKNVENKKIYSWASAVDYVASIEKAFGEGTHNLYGYNYKKYGFKHYDGLIYKPFFDVLKDYARLHFLYVFNASFLLANYPIRERKEKQTLGNSVRWNFDFFDFDKDYEKISKLSKILDFDCIRTGVRFDELNPVNDSFEFGILVITEADKEQANAEETKEESMKSPYPNPKNDGMTFFEKFIRHRATIMGYCFAVLFKDGQRVMSLKADARELATLEHMQRPKKEKNALPFFWIEKTGAYISKFIDKYFLEEKEYYRGDNTLFHYFLMYLSAVLYNFYYRRKNRYGYIAVKKVIEAGTQNGKETIVLLYLLFAIMNADTYKTDTHSSHFEEKARESGTGIANYPEYKESRMSDRELEMQNSYSAKNMRTPNWKRELIAKAEAEQEKKKAEAKAKAEAEREKRKAEAKAKKQKEE